VKVGKSDCHHQHRRRREAGYHKPKAEKQNCCAKAELELTVSSNGMEQVMLTP